MGAGVSKEEVVAYLVRQETLVSSLKSQIGAPAGGSSDTNILLKHKPNDFSAPSSGKMEVLPVYMKDETTGLSQRVRSREKFLVEPTVDELELQQPHVEWVAPTESEEEVLLATKPWLGAIAPSLRFQHGAHDKAPAVKLELEHVYGFRSNGIRHHVRWVDDKTLLYPAGATVVLHNVETNEQRFFHEHNDDILSVTIHRGQNLAATADQGRFPIIYVWDLTTLKIKARLTGTLRRGVSSLAFDATGTRVIALGLDEDNSLAVYDWAKGKCIAYQPSDSEGRVFRITGNREATSMDQYPFLTVGENHIAFWSISESGKLTKKNGSLGTFGDVQTFTTADSDDIGNFIGTQQGEVYCFIGTKLVRVIDCHQGAVLALRINPSGSLLITGGHDGYTCTFGIQQNFKRLSSTLFSSFSDPETLRHRPNSVRAIDLWESQPGKVRSAVACVAGSISIVSAAGQTKQVVQAHFGDLSKDDMYAELWGLAVHPTLNRFVSAGDFTIFMWDAEQRKIIAKANLKSRGHCAVYSCNGKFVVIGRHDGSVVIYDGSDLKELQTIKVCKRSVQCVRFSPDSSLLAVGTADNTIEIYDVASGFTHGGSLAGSKSVITNLDFSQSGQYIQAVAQTFELLFFDVNAMELLPSGSSTRAAMQDIPWFTQTCTLGWNVQGIWPQGSELDDVNSVSRSNDGSMMVTAEESGLVKVYQFPCVGGGLDREGVLRRRPDSVRGKGHGAKATQAAFLSKDDRVISIGGTDLCCFQWKVVPV